MLNRRWVLVVVALCALAGAARADNKEARMYFEQGNASFALGQYAAAAAAYEKAFAARPDPALLYNAAQSHRLANNKSRALLLYKNYISVYGDKVGNRDEVQRHIATLKQAIEIEERSQTSPPTGTAPVEGHSRIEPTPARPPEPARTEVKQTSAAPRPANRVKLFAGIGVAAGGVALMVTGGALFGVAGAAADEINNPVPGYVFRPESESLARDGGAAGIALLAVGGAAVATGVVLAVIGARESKSSRLALAKW